MHSTILQYCDLSLFAGKKVQSSSRYLVTRHKLDHKDEISEHPPVYRLVQFAYLTTNENKQYFACFGTGTII